MELSIKMSSTLLYFTLFNSQPINDLYLLYRTGWILLSCTEYNAYSQLFSTVEWKWLFKQVSQQCLQTVVVWQQYGDYMKNKTTEDRSLHFMQNFLILVSIKGEILCKYVSNQPTKQEKTKREEEGQYCPTYRIGSSC